ncbi:DNA methyltransferase, partial [uncultured Deinococcus sp.]|uniref:DNA methyltransferase n=1 Tax=uncultured Deinococcus sp. TaxID=158789 RepID=UPI00258D9F60
TNPGDHVLDPFAGSGSTGAACVALRRDFVGIELDSTYHAIAERRVRHAQPALLGAS